MQVLDRVAIESWADRGFDDEAVSDGMSKRVELLLRGKSLWKSYFTALHFEKIPNLTCFSPQPPTLFLFDCYCRADCLKLTYDLLI